MIVTENCTIKGRELVKTYSDSGVFIERDGVQYCEAYDPAEFGRQYTETDIPIEVPEEDDIITQKAKAYDILTGVSE